MQIHETGHNDAAFAIDHSGIPRRNAARRSDPGDSSALDENVASGRYRSARAVDDPNVLNQHPFRDGRRVGDGPTQTSLLTFRGPQTQSSRGDEEQSAVARSRGVERSIFSNRLRISDH